MIRGKVFLAPMAGVADSVFRRICKRFGADIVVSEMVSAEAVNMGAVNTKELMRIDQAERPAGIQIFGAKPDSMARAAAFIAEHVRPDFIDINSGCPVPKVIRKNGGAALLREPELFRAIVGEVVKAAGDVPVTVKIRSGWNVNEWIDIDFAKMVEDAGAAALTLHPRSKTMMFSGHSFWDRIALVKQSISIPVIGNGDIVAPADGLKMLRETGCDAIMIGRGAYGNPWIFDQVKAVIAGKEPIAPSSIDRLRIAKEHLELSLAELGETQASREMKKHLAWYIHGMPGASVLRNDVFRAESCEKMIGLIERMFSVVA